MIAQLKQNACPHSVFDSLLNLSLPDYMRRDIKALKRDFQHLSTLSPKEAFRFIQKDLEYEAYIENHAATFGSSKTTSMRILYYIKYIASTCKSYDDFIGRLKTVDQLLRGGRAQEKGLVLSTLHGAKGLEFDTVFLIDLNADTIPLEAGANSTEAEAEGILEEERRLFYVGMTRAKNRLYCLRPKSIDGQTCLPSNFFIWAKDDTLRQRKDR